ncbi:MAG TPA: NAD-dependent epimerase/dehydratase family protein [Stellaceae bacterium]
MAMTRAGEPRRRRVLVTGATGFVGRALLPVLHESGWDVTAALRRPPEAGASLAAPARTVVLGEFGPETDWPAALHPPDGGGGAAPVDAVVHLAARVHVMREADPDPDAAFNRANAEATARLAVEAARAGVSRFVYLSSVKVNGERTAPGRPFREDDPPMPEDAYARSKLAAETALARLAGETAGMSITVLRPPLIYGPAVRGNFLSLIRLAGRGIPLPLGGVEDNRRSLLAVGNLADAIRRVLDTADPPGFGGYLLRDGEDLSTAALLRRLAAALGRPARLVPVPPAILAAALRALGRGGMAERLLGSLQIDDSRFRETFAWTPPLTVDEGLRQAAAWFRSSR